MAEIVKAAVPKVNTVDEENEIVPALNLLRKSMEKAVDACNQAVEAIHDASPLAASDSNDENESESTETEQTETKSPIETESDEAAKRKEIEDEYQSLRKKSGG